MCSWGGTVSSYRQGDDYHGDHNGDHDLDDHNGDHKGDDHNHLLVPSDVAMLAAKRESIANIHRARKLFSDKDIAVAVRRKAY